MSLRGGRRLHAAAITSVVAAVMFAWTVFIMGTANAAESVKTQASGSSPGGIGMQLLPEAGSKEPASAYITNRISPGSSVVRKISVSNTTPSTVQVALYAAAASVVDNAFTFANGHEANDASSYTTVTPSTISLAAGATTTAVATIKVPSDGAPGPQNAVIWAEASSGGTGIVEVNRVGIREYLSIGAGGLAPPDFSLGELTASNDAAGMRVLTTNVHNTGGRILNLSGNLALSAGPAGTSAGPFPATIPDSVAPDGTAAVTVTLPAALPAGPWTGLLTVKASNITHTASTAVTFPDANGATGSSTAATGTGGRSFPIPVIGVVGAVGVVALTGAAGFGVHARSVKLRRLRPSRHAALPPR